MANRGKFEKRVKNCAGGSITNFYVIIVVFKWFRGTNVLLFHLTLEITFLG